MTSLSYRFLTVGQGFILLKTDLPMILSESPALCCQALAGGRLYEPEAIPTVGRDWGFHSYFCMLAFCLD
ncbi:MAG: hypothetical protein ISS66_04965 [Desulfobacteraceae bacterium]|nr:hypothetical protein [Desulfobacteraceae bacterium]